MRNAMLYVEVQVQFSTVQAEAMVSDFVSCPDFVDRYIELWGQVTEIQSVPERRKRIQRVVIGRIRVCVDNLRTR